MARLGGILERLGRLLARLGCRLERLGRVLGRLGSHAGSPARLRFFGGVGGLSCVLGGIFGASGGLIGAPGGLLGGLLKRLGASWGPLGVQEAENIGAARETENKSSLGRPRRLKINLPWGGPTHP